MYLSSSISCRLYRPLNFCESIPEALNEVEKFIQMYRFLLVSLNSAV